MQRSSPGWAFYRLLVLLLPRSFRDRFGKDMEDVLAFRLDRATSAGARGWVWLEASWDVLGHAVTEWLRIAFSNRDGRGSMGGLSKDLRYAVRSLTKSPLFTVMAALTMALGIGASTATFSVVGTVLFKHLPYADPEGLVVIWPKENFNVAMVREAVDASPALEAGSGISGWTLTLVGAGEPIEVEANRVSPNYFRILGTPPALGRAFDDDEGLPGTSDVVVLSHAFWLRAFGGDPDILGRSIPLAGADNESYTVIGVMPPDFQPVVGKPEVWIPLAAPASLAAEDDDTWFVNHRVARLAPGATLEQASEQVRDWAYTIQARLPRKYDIEEAAAAGVQPLQEYKARTMGPVLWVTLGAVSLVLLIACANVANLLLARGESKRGELAVRMALGAGRERVVRMLLAESALLGLMGGAAGIALSLLLVRTIVALAPADFPRISEVAVDGPVLAYAVAITMASILAAGLIPAIRASRVSATASMGGSARGAVGRRGSRLTPALVAVEVALAVVVTVGSGLMLRSLDRLLTVDRGLDAQGVLSFRVSPPEGTYDGADAMQAYYGQVLDRVKGLPGVTQVGAIHLLPGTRDNWSFPTWPQGFDIPEGTPIPSVNFRAVWPGYFETVREPLVLGRLLQPSDDKGAERVALVNQAFVDKYWPGLDPIGRDFRTLQSSDPSYRYRVVGVVGNVRQHGLGDEPRPELYVPYAQWRWSMSLWVVARFDGSTSPMDHATDVRQAVWSVNDNIPITGMEELAGVFGDSAATTRFLALILTSFGALALALGAVGVFGVTAYTVSRRIPEFGVRVALGSSRSSVLGTALVASLAPVAGGLVVGLLAAAGLSGALKSALFGVEPSDAVTYVGVAALLAAVAVVASLLPALRASRVDPVTVLKGD